MLGPPASNLQGPSVRFCQQLSDARRAAVPIRRIALLAPLLAHMPMPIEAHASDRARNHFETLGKRADKPLPARTNTQAPGNTKRRVASASSSSSITKPRSSAFLRAFSLAAFFFFHHLRFRSLSFSRISRSFSSACRQKCLSSCHKKETLPPRLLLEQLSTAHASSCLLPFRQPCAFVLPACAMFTSPFGLGTLLRPPRLCVPFLLQRGVALWPPWPGPGPWPRPLPPPYASLLPRP